MDIILDLCKGVSIQKGSKATILVGIEECQV